MVLPLRNLSGDASRDYFVDGMTEAIIARLASVPQLQVTSRTTVMQFREVATSIPQIARTLKVDAVVEGSVARAGNRVRVTVRLFDGRNDSTVWTREFEGESEDDPRLQGEVAQAVAASLRAKAAPSNPVQDCTVPPEVYRHYLKGRFLLTQNTRASIQQAVSEFDEALAVDLTFAPGVRRVGLRSRRHGQYDARRPGRPRRQ